MRKPGKTRKKQEKIEEEIMWRKEKNYMKLRPDEDGEERGQVNNKAKQ